jgi:hypothetical protein
LCILPAEFKGETMKKLIILLTLTLAMMFGQTKLETRVYSTGNLNNLEVIDIDSIVGFDVGNGSLSVHNIIFSTSSSSANIQFRTIAPSGEYWSIYIGLRSDGSWHPYGEMTLVDGYTYAVDFASVPVDSFELELAITAEFPEEDTGYIEDGFDYCVEPGANLMSYPCDSAVALLDAIPSDALSQFSGIIGQGIAATQLPNGTWVGSLTAMQASSGYWIQSNTSLCFNYDCSEN